ncbi:MAG: flagellar protein FlbB [Spirochaetales bacterium]|nr:flagellar protein FlbB [Spirochaetales bacterium]
MKSYSRGGGIAKIIFLLAVIVALVIGGLVWLDFLGVMDIRENLAPITSLFGVNAPAKVEDPLAPALLDADRLAKERDALSMEWNRLNLAEEDLALREAEVLQKESLLAERERELDEKQKSLNAAISRYDNRVANLEQTARYMMGMPPQDAVAIMDEYDTKDLVDLLRTSERLSQESGEASLVAFWISIMPDRGRAAEVQGLLVDKPGPNLEG